jgi:hypothetical protein
VAGLGLGADIRAHLLHIISLFASALDRRCLKESLHIICVVITGMRVFEIMEPMQRPMLR